MTVNQLGPRLSHCLTTGSPLATGSVDMATTLAPATPCAHRSDIALVSSVPRRGKPDTPGSRRLSQRPPQSSSAAPESPDVAPHHSSALRCPRRIIGAADASAGWFRRAEPLISVRGGVVVAETDFFDPTSSSRAAASSAARTAVELRSEVRKNERLRHGDANRVGSRLHPTVQNARARGFLHEPPVRDRRQKE